MQNKKYTVRLETTKAVAEFVNVEVMASSREDAVKKAENKYEDGTISGDWWEGEILNHTIDESDKDNWEVEELEPTLGVEDIEKIEDEVIQREIELKKSKNDIVIKKIKFLKEKYHEQDIIFRSNECRLVDFVPCESRYGGIKALVYSYNQDGKLGKREVGIYHQSNWSNYDSYFRKSENYKSKEK